MQRQLLLYLLLLLTTVSSSGQIEFHFYNKDHLGNVREVVDTHGNVEQIVHYYPSGTPFTDGSGEHPNFQEHLYSGKELDKMHGLNTYDHGARQYDPILMRWDRVDNLCEKYYPISPYAMCGNDPVRFIDPDGKDGGISIYGNAITISANVYLYGNGATNAVLQQMQNDINRIWGGNHSVNHNGKPYNVKLNISLSLYGGREKNSPQIIADSWNPFSRNNYIEVTDDCQRSYVIGGDEGQWRSVGRNGKSLLQDDPAPHEVGHLLGLPDQYTDEKGPNKGRESNIMGNSVNGNVDNRNINDILQNAWSEYDKWIKNDNKGEFKYESNP